MRPPHVTGYREVAGDPWAWWYRLCVVWITSVHAMIGAALIFGPARWERSNSLQAIHDISHVPWAVWGVGFILLAAAIGIGRTRKVGYLAAATVGALFVAASILWVVVPGKATNPITIGLSTFSILMMIAGARYVTQQEATRKVTEVLDRDAER